MQPADSKPQGAAPSPGRMAPLRDRRQCARFVASLIRGAHRGSMPLERVRTLVYATQVLAGLIERAEIDDRIAAIESRIALQESTR
jgi:hypothetical protein